MSSVLVTRVYSNIPIFYLVNFEILEHFGNFRVVYKEKLFVTRKDRKLSNVSDLLLLSIGERPTVGPQVAVILGDLR